MPIFIWVFLPKPIPIPDQLSKWHYPDVQAKDRWVTLHPAILSLPVSKWPGWTFLPLSTLPHCPSHRNLLPRLLQQLPGWSAGSTLSLLPVHILYQTGTVTPQLKWPMALATKLKPGLQLSMPLPIISLFYILELTWPSTYSVNRSTLFG